MKAKDIFPIIFVEGAVIIEGVKGEAIGLTCSNFPGGGSGLILNGGHDEF